MASAALLGETPPKLLGARAVDLRSGLPWFAHKIMSSGAVCIIRGWGCSALGARDDNRKESGVRLGPGILQESMPCPSWVAV